MIFGEIETTGWWPWLLKNQAYRNGDPKLGRTTAGIKAMWDLVMLLRPAVGYGFKKKWNGERLQVVITAYRPSNVSDAQNFVDAISDAVEDALGINDSNYDVFAFGKIDKTCPRIRITIMQGETINAEGLE